MAGVTATDVLQDFEDRNCLGVVIFQDAWENAQAGNTPTAAHDGSSPELNHCDKVRVNLQVSWAVSTSSRRRPVSLLYI